MGSQATAWRMNSDPSPKNQTLGTRSVHTPSGALTPHQHPITALENWHNFLISPMVIFDIILNMLKENKKQKTLAKPKARDSLQQSDHCH